MYVGKGSPGGNERRLIEDGVFLEVVRDGGVESLALQPLLGEESALVSVGTVSEDSDNGRA